MNSRVSIPKCPVLDLKEETRILPNGSFDNAGISGFARF